MKRAGLIYGFLTLVILVGAGFTLRLRGQGESQVPAENPELPVDWVEDLNSSIVNDLSSLPAMDQVVPSSMPGAMARPMPPSR